MLYLNSIIAERGECNGIFKRQIIRLKAFIP